MPQDWARPRSEAPAIEVEKLRRINSSRNVPTRIRIGPRRRFILYCSARETYGMDSTL